MAEDNGRPAYSVHDRRPGKAGRKRQARRKRGAARHRTRTGPPASKTAGSQCRQVASPPSDGARRRVSPRTITPKPGPQRRKPREAGSVAPVCIRGVTARAQVKGGLPIVLRCAGRRDRSAPGPKLGLRRRATAEDLRRRHGDPAMEQGPQARAVADGSSWALPLPHRDEPLVVSAPPVVAVSAAASGLAPLARNRAPVPWRDGFMAHMEAWLRGAAERLGRIIGPSPASPRKATSPAPRRVQPMVPAVARANREINLLRQENERLRREIAALELMRGSASPVGHKRVMDVARA